MQRIRRVPGGSLPHRIIELFGNRHVGSLGALDVVASRNSNPHRCDIAQRSTTDNLGHLMQPLVRSHFTIHAKYTVIGAHGIDDRLSLCHRPGNWFFQRHMLSLVCGCHGHGRMPVIGC